MVRIPGDVVDPDLLWWQSRGPRSVQREPAPEEEVRRRIREEDEHVRRYMYLLVRQYDGRWSFLQRVPAHVSYDPVRVPSLCQQLILQPAINYAKPDNYAKY